MGASLLRYLFPPKSTDYEQAQRARLLHVMLIVTFSGSLLIGLQNFSNGWFREAAVLFALSVASLAGIYINHASRPRLAAFIICLSLLTTIHLALFHGAGLYDSGILGYPIFILCASFLFGRRGLMLASACSIGSVVLLHVLERMGISGPGRLSSPYRVVNISTLFILLALITWVVRETWETNMLRLRESYDLTLRGWAKALEYRDGETAGHTRRVTQLCADLARRLGCSEPEILQIQRGAYLHDIGKMAIPDDILHKPGPLDAAEREIMNRHPAMAIDMVSEIDFLRPALSIPYSHHEHWDGSGYPDGLKGEQIPLAARIFTVVDHWDALGSDRPYRKAWPREDVVAYLRENAGRIYDPQIVEVFLKIVL
jgi:putative nucleotidyltransferase with HDIG domain